MILNMMCFKILPLLFMVLLILDLSKDVNASTVAFSALKRDHGRNYGTVLFEDVKLNEGSGYSSSSGQFTAPCDGFYVFSWSVITQQKSSVATQLVVNGKVYGKAFADSRESIRIMDDAASNTIPVRMRRGQTAYITVIRGWGSFIDGNGWSSFSGWKIGC